MWEINRTAPKHETRRAPEQETGVILNIQLSAPEHETGKALNVEQRDPEHEKRGS
jgi:hypothetical protein